MDVLSPYADSILFGLAVTLTVFLLQGRNRLPFRIKTDAWHTWERRWWYEHDIRMERLIEWLGENRWATIYNPTAQKMLLQAIAPLEMYILLTKDKEAGKLLHNLHSFLDEELCTQGTEETA